MEQLSIMFHLYITVYSVLGSSTWTQVQVSMTILHDPIQQKQVGLVYDCIQYSEEPTKGPGIHAVSFRRLHFGDQINGSGSMGPIIGPLDYSD